MMLRKMLLKYIPLSIKIFIYKIEYEYLYRRAREDQNVVCPICSNRGAKVFHLGLIPT